MSFLAGYHQRRPAILACHVDISAILDKQFSTFQMAPRTTPVKGCVLILVSDRNKQWRKKKMTSCEKNDGWEYFYSEVIHTFVWVSAMLQQKRNNFMISILWSNNKWRPHTASILNVDVEVFHFQQSFNHAVSSLPTGAVQWRVSVLVLFIKPRKSFINILLDLLLISFPTRLAQLVYVHGSRGQFGTVVLWDWGRCLWLDF